MQIHLQIKTMIFSTEVIARETGRLMSILTFEGQNLHKYEII